MIEDIKNTLSKDFENLRFDLSSWNQVLNTSSDISVFHLERTIEYYSAYFQGTNMSFVLYESNKPVAVVPLFAYQDKGEWKISSNESGLISPLFTNDVPKRLRRRLEKQILEIIDIISSKLKIGEIILFEHSQILSSWFQLWLERANKDFITYQLAIDLQNTIESIRLGFRKSYKPLVNKSLKEWSLEVCTDNIEEPFEEFRKLHLEVAGKTTRSMETWNIQKEQIRSKEAFLVTVRDGMELIGAGLFNYSRDIGIYSVGAYKRELFDKPIGHAVQMVAIKKLKDVGCKTYLLGQKATNLKTSYSSSKDLSISHFKEGFAGYLYAQPHLEINMNE
jgi:FemAB family protein